MKYIVSRRDFLAKALTGAAFLRPEVRFGLSATGEPGTSAAKSKVVIAHDALLRGGGTAVDSRRMLGLVDRAMQALFDRDNPIEAWRKLVCPGEMVGLKVNTLGGPGISSNLLLVEAVCERLQEVGIKAADIMVWDRSSDELERAGFRVSINGKGVQCCGTDRVGYEEEMATHGSVGSRLSKILTRRSAVLINIPVLKDHDGAGATIALKNMFGVIHNPNKYHPDGCDPYIADLNMLPEIRTRLRLHLCDASTAIYEGGPGYKPEHSWKCNSLLVSQDPVALDYSGWQMIERKRAERGFKTLEAEQRAPRYLATAADAQHRLGTNDPARILRVEV